MPGDNHEHGQRSHKESWQMVTSGVYKDRSIWKWQSNTAVRIWKQERPLVQFEKNQPVVKKAVQSTLFRYYLQHSVLKFHYSMLPTTPTPTSSLFFIGPNFAIPGKSVQKSVPLACLGGDWKGGLHPSQVDLYPKAVFIPIMQVNGCTHTSPSLSHL